MAQLLRALGSHQGTPYPHARLNTVFTAVSRGLMTTTGLNRHQAHTCYTDIHEYKISIHLKIICLSQCIRKSSQFWSKKKGKTDYIVTLCDDNTHS